MTQKISPEDLIAEICQNAREDRDRLKKFAEGLRKFAERGNPESGGDEDSEMDPDVALALSEQMAKVSDSLTKINQQLVTLVQIDSKTKKGDDLSGPVNMSAKEKEDIFNQVENDVELDS